MPYSARRKSCREQRERGDNPDGLQEIYARVINYAPAERPAGHGGHHPCLPPGNFRSTWISSGGYEPVAETMLAGTNYGRLLPRICDPDRAGGFEPLRYLPKGNKVVVVGVITLKFGELEKKRTTSSCRLEEAAEFAPLDQLAVSPQCGFASTEEGNILVRGGAVAKLSPRGSKSPTRCAGEVASHRCADGGGFRDANPRRHHHRCGPLRALRRDDARGRASAVMALEKAYRGPAVARGIHLALSSSPTATIPACPGCRCRRTIRPIPSGAQVVTYLESLRGPLSDQAWCSTPRSRASGAMARDGWPTHRLMRCRRRSWWWRPVALRTRPTVRPGRELDIYSGAVVHSSNYRNPEAFSGRRVLVIGFGNSGGEIALDRAASSGVDGALAVRSPVQILPRDLLGVPPPHSVVGDPVPAVARASRRFHQRAGAAAGGGQFRGPRIPQARRGKAGRARWLRRMDACR